MNNRIKEICKNKNIRISKVIKETGLAKSYVYRVMDGESVPTLKTARKIAAVLNSKLEDVFPEELKN